MMQMPVNTFRAMVAKCGGEIVNGIARFPNPEAKAQYNRDCDDLASGVVESRRKQIAKP